MTPEFDPRRLRYATTPAQVGEFLGALEAHSGPVVLDGETTGRKTVDQPWSRIACMAFALPRDWDDTDPAVWAVALSHPQAATREGWRKLLTEIAGVIEDRGFDLVNQNLPFDLKWVRALTGIDLSAQAVWDTAMAARLLQDEGSVGLKTLVPKMFDIEAWDDGIDFHQRELEQNAEARATGRPPQRRIAERVPLYELMFYAACVAEGQMVLTDRGEVPIERVSREHLLWDGVEWVRHDGVVCKGTQLVLELDKLRATPDHLVLTEDGDYVCFTSAVAGNRRIATPAHEAARGGLLDPDRPSGQASSTSASGSDLHTLRKDLLEDGKHAPAWSLGVHVPVGGQVGEGSAGSSAGRSLPRDRAAVHSGASHQQGARRPWDRVEVRVSGALHPLDIRTSASRNLSGSAVRSDRRRGALRAGKSSTLYPSAEQQSKTRHRICAVHGAAGCPGSPVGPDQDGPAGLLPEQIGSRQSAPARADGGTDPRAPASARVFDIINAGPRNRFTVSGVVVSNCDVFWTWRLAQAQQETFASWDDMDPEMRQLGRLHEIVSVPTVRAMTRLSGNGLLVDREWMADKRAELVTECEKVDQQITDLSGLDPCSTYEPSSKIFRDWADRKAAEGLLQPVAVTKTGKISWSYSSLVANRQAGHEMADLLIQYRKASKQVQMLDSWAPFIGADGRVRPNYNLYRTVTGRLSSSDPNAQQLARVLKPMVIAPPGKVILEADLSQAELRIMAFVAPSEPMKQALIRGDDLHRMIAAEILGLKPEDVTKDGRQKGKAINFGFGFTMREEKFIEYAAIQYDTHFSYEEAVAARRAFFDLWEGLEQWHQRVEYEVLSDGYVVSPIGRIRRPAGAKGDYRQQYRAISQATNAPVQGFVSDIMMISAGLITTEMPWITPVACVHDSFVFEVPESRVQEAAEGVRLYMTGEPLYIELRKLGCELDVPLVVDVKAGARWGIGEEL
jgi:DNA polymerase I-like protein with 3'-5' exonuclease and polymerase domains